ncbi:MULTISPECIES: hypothetical protein [unclassified Bradyrhizobium]|uniref:hypothetical protein n=1 Tax=unclassified Bradyrhizobium TaxID=2631580 RepID=UPI00201C27A6|nr:MULTISPECIES: hypothetical protein [unclassified Bradyrhizobium]
MKMVAITGNNKKSAVMTMMAATPMARMASAGSLAKHRFRARNVFLPERRFRADRFVAVENLILTLVQVTSPVWT